MLDSALAARSPQSPAVPELLHGCARWKGTISAVAPGHALVRYDALNEAEDVSQPLQEWFREPCLEGAADTPDFPGRFHVHDEPASIMRPEPPAHVRSARCHLSVIVCLALRYE